MASALTTTRYQTTELRKTVRLLLYGNHLNRDNTTDKDQRYLNLMPETSKNLVNDLKKFYLIKRPGTAVYSSPATASEGRGVWYWNGSTYSVFGNKFYKDDTLKKTLLTSTGMCGTTPIFTTEGEKLFFCDGLKGYTIDSTGTVEDVEKAIFQWLAEEILEVGDTRLPTTPNGYYYTVSAATGQKTTGATEPTWPTTIGNTVVDDEITWTCTAAYTGAGEWEATTAYTLGDVVIPTIESGIYYKCTIAGTSGATEPTDWPPNVYDVPIIDGTVTWEFGGYYGGFPSPHIPQPTVLDGYLVLAEKDSIDAYNSAVLNPASWDALSFFSAESFSDPIIALARQNNYIVAFGENNTEMFYDAANAEGSPFSRNESFLLQTGLIAPNAICQAERFVIWIGRSDAGKNAVWLMDGFNPKEISTEYIEKLLYSETSPASITGYGLRIMGHFLYIINLPSTNKTLVYDVEEMMWSEWSYNDLELPFVSYSDAAGTPLIQHTSDGKIYKLDASKYQDEYTGGTYPINCLAITDKKDFDSTKRKFAHRIEVIGDQVESNISLSWSDDDYQTWSNVKTLSLAERAYFMRGGAFRRRAFKLNHTANTSLRLESIELVYTQGDI